MSMSSQQTIQKLALYAVAKERLENPERTLEMGLDPHKISVLAARLRKELLDEGMSKYTLDVSGEELTMTIFETLQKHGL